MAQVIERELLHLWRDSAENLRCFSRSYAFTNDHARFQIYYVEPPLAVILRQNRNRPSSVPESVIHRLNDQMEIPTLAEAHGVTLVGPG